MCHLSLVVWSYESGIRESIDPQVRNSVGSLFNILRPSRENDSGQILTYFLQREFIFSQTLCTWSKPYRRD